MLRKSSKSVIVQEEATGCGIASVANLAGRSYAEVKARANAMDIYADDAALYSDTQYVRRLLKAYAFHSVANETLFTSWDELPDLALLAIKYHKEKGCSFWHWVVFKREQGLPVVLDSADYLDSHTRTDFAAMYPKWYIEILASHDGPKYE